ncbi:hypothetical protein [Staphylococcus pseudoxylosus]|jgi:hypothetical protein|uniref:hypothetical protein n=1 Tax=Staphylococcus TaxID=1279 RepID=UPI002DBCB04A|nr:hypothetical protein [Staphylococcus pseudoxylosus]MEB6059565.1 hypothetical protein [Staphylococcus pseudoxylosus]
MSEETITLKAIVKVEKKVTITYKHEDYKQDAIDKEADKMFYSPAKELAFEDIEFVDIMDVQEKEI